MLGGDAAERGGDVALVEDFPDGLDTIGVAEVDVDDAIAADQVAPGLPGALEVVVLDEFALFLREFRLFGFAGVVVCFKPF